MVREGKGGEGIRISRIYIRGFSRDSGEENLRRRLQMGYLMVLLSTTKTLTNLNQGYKGNKAIV
jgi:hypothetical protein